MNTLTKGILAAATALTGIGVGVITWRESTKKICVKCTTWSLDTSTSVTRTVVRITIESKTWTTHTTISFLRASEVPPKILEEISKGEPWVIKEYAQIPRKLL